MSATQWFVYILQCHDGSLYTGITTDPARRVREHNHGTRGARYTRSRRPVRLLYQEAVDSRSSAQQREHLLRHLPRKQKQQLCGLTGTDTET